MVHPQRTSDEKRPGRGRQRINPREFATTGPRTPETAANYLLHRGLRQDGGGDQRGVSRIGDKYSQGLCDVPLKGRPDRSSDSHRRGKGDKANKKQMAAVGAVYTIKPFVRTADDVIEEVMREKARQRRPSPQHKRVRAELLVGKVALFLWLAQETIRRNPQGTKPVIFLSDGERALHDRQSEYL